MTRFIHASILTLFAASMCWAADAVPDGTWKWSSEMGDRTINSVLQLTVDGGELSGVYKDQNIEKEIQNAKLEDGRVSFDFDVEFNDSVVNVKFDGEVKDSSIEGTVKFFANGEQQGEDYPWNPNRHVGKQEVLGIWHFEFQSPDGVTYTPTLEVVEQNGQLVGLMTGDEDSDEGDSVSVDDLKLEDNQLTFSQVIEYDGEMELKYVCHPRGNKLVGVLQYKSEGATGEFDIAAARSALTREAKQLLGEWELSIVTENGDERNPVLTVAEKSGALVVKLVEGSTEFDLENVRCQGAELSFDFTADANGNEIQIKLSCIAVGDDEVEGTVQYEAGDNSGEIELQGERR